MTEPGDLFDPPAEGRGPGGAGNPPAPAAGAARRKQRAGRWLGGAIVAAALVLVLWVIRATETHPRSDDAEVTADLVRIAPGVSGHIVELAVRDGQAVKEGDLLFVIDPRPYELVLERARAEKALVESEILQMARNIEAARAGAEGAEANLRRVRCEHELAAGTLDRLEPLLSRGFVTAEVVDQARAAERATAEALAMAREASAGAALSVPLLAPLETRLLGIDAAIREAELELHYTRVRAPLDGRVVNLNIARGTFAAVGVPVFVMIDTSAWYVSANFRETDLRRIRPGMKAELHVMTDPDRRFSGTVDHIGWAVHSEEEFDLFGIPFIRRTLNWVRLAQRFPVRIRVDDPRPEEVFRMGASAVATILPEGGEGR